MTERGKFTDEVKRKILNHIRCGVHPEIACRAVGVSANSVAKGCSKGDPAMLEFREEMRSAAAKCEVDNVRVTARAARIEKRDLVCPHCDHEFKADLDELTAMVEGGLRSQQVVDLAAKNSMLRLERRFPKRWSPRVTHTVEEEHSELLNVAEAVLAPEVFELLLEAYLARRNGEDASGDSEGEPPAGGVH